MTTLAEKYNELDKALAVRKHRLMDEILPMLVKFKQETGLNVFEITIGWGEVTTGIPSSQGPRRSYMDNYIIRVS